MTSPFSTPSQPHATQQRWANPSPQGPWPRRLRAPLVVAGLLATGLAWALPLQTTYAQGNVQETVLPVAPSVLAAIREAPFSEMFSVSTPNAGQAFAIKDQDFQGSNPQIGVVSLWADAPDIDLLQVALRYCLPDEAIARTDAHLVEVELRLNGQTLVTIDQPAVSTDASLYEVEPERYVTTTVYPSTFYDPFWNPYSYSTPYYTSTYSPAVNCSLGGSRLDLNPVRAELAALPNETLDMRLLFSNGMTSNWRLGRGTVSALKQLPSIQGN